MSTSDHKDKLKKIHEMLDSLKEDIDDYFEDLEKNPTKEKLADFDRFAETLRPYREKLINDVQPLAPDNVPDFDPELFDVFLDKLQKIIDKDNQ